MSPTSVHDELLKQARELPVGVAAMVAEFHEAFGVTTRDEPVVAIPESPLRVALLGEEFGEYLTACAAGDLVEIADALADIVYVAYGTALAHGVDLDAVLAEVHRANMSKLGADGKPVLRADGKVTKGPNYTAPDVAAVLSRQGAVPPRGGSKLVEGHTEMLKQHAPELDATSWFCRWCREWGPCPEYRRAVAALGLTDVLVAYACEQHHPGEPCSPGRTHPGAAS